MSIYNWHTFVSHMSFHLGLFPSARVVVTSKADALFPIVSAASICAKVTRDHGLDTWKFDEKGITPTREFGSGYPGKQTWDVLEDAYDVCHDVTYVS